MDGIRGEMTFVAVRSRGPGGQNVNKVTSAAVLYWDYGASAFLSPEQKELVRVKLARFINSEGRFWIRSDEFRDLEKNKSRCLEKLNNLLISAFHVPKKRKATKPSRASKMKGRAKKERRSETKRMRRRIS